MTFLSSIVFALVLCASSGGLMGWHRRVWKRLQEEESDQEEREFHRRQYRRRMQTSAMLGVLGVAIFVGQLLIVGIDSRPVLVIYWSGVLLLVLWLVLLALADITATSFYYSREKNQFIVDHAKLQGELRRARAEKAKVRNGKPKSSL